MTREEAIGKWIYPAITTTWNEKKCNEILEALEQEPVLDKIRAEIEQEQDDFMDDKDYDEGIRFGLMLAYQIIDKYKAESE